MTTTSQEGYENGVGRKWRNDLKRRWRAEGLPQGLSLKQWAKQAGIGDAAFVWYQHKKAVR